MKRMSTRSLVAIWFAIALVVGWCGGSKTANHRAKEKLAEVRRNLDICQTLADRVAVLVADQGGPKSREGEEKEVTIEVTVSQYGDAIVFTPNHIGTSESFFVVFDPVTGKPQGASFDCPE